MTEQKKICIIDDDPTLLTLLAYIFKNDHKVVTCKSGNEAIQLFKNYIPDLIILDIMMPEMDGFEVCQQLNKNARTASIPVIMLTAKKDLESRIKGLKLGVVDYIEKPFNRTEFKIRVQNILNQYKIQISDESSNILEQINLSILAFIRDQENKTIIPKPNPNNYMGYEYPGLDKFLTKKEEFIDVSFVEKINGNKNISNIYVYLENLAEKKVLVKKIYDKVHICPFCEHYNINFREVCDSCNSIQIETVDMIHHFRCAYVGPEKEFQKGLDYICPKCNQILRHIGVDYEKPSRTYICNNCENIFNEATVNCLCLNCQNTFDVEKAINSAIYKYTLTEAGELALEKGHIDEPSFEHAFWDLHSELYTFSFLQHLLIIEEKRAQRYNRPFSIILFELGNMDELLHQHGRIVLSSLLLELVRIIKESTRDTDIPSQYSEIELLFLLPETPLDGAKKIIERIRKKTLTFHYQMHLNIIIVEYPQSGNTIEELFDGIAKGVIRAHERGGNQTISYIRK